MLKTKFQNNLYQNYGGYIALSTVLIVLALVLLIGVSTSLLSINDLLSSQSGKMSNGALNLAESCAENALLVLNEENTLPSSITLPQGFCSVTINSQTGSLWDFTVVSVADGYQKYIRINANRGATVTINSWTESG